jgi:acyl carrier protein
MSPRSGSAPLQATGVRFRRPLPVLESGTTAQVTLVRDELTGTSRVRIHDAEARCVAGAEVAVIVGAETSPALDLAEAEPLLAAGMPGAQFSSILAAHGLTYGSAYRRLERVAHRGMEAFARIGRPAAGSEPGALFIPALLDAALQAVLAPILTDLYPNDRPISTGIDRVVWHRPLTTESYVHAVVRDGDYGWRADVVVYDLLGEPLIEAQGVGIRRSRGTAVEPALPEPDNSGTAVVPTQSPAELEARVLDCVAGVTRLPVGAIEPEQRLRELGVDSLMMLELRNRLETTFAVEVATTEILARPTVSELVALIADGIGIPLD